MKTSVIQLSALLELIKVSLVSSAPGETPQVLRREPLFIFAREDELVVLKEDGTQLVKLESK